MNIFHQTFSRRSHIVPGDPPNNRRANGDDCRALCCSVNVRIKRPSAFTCLGFLMSHGPNEFIVKKDRFGEALLELIVGQPEVLQI